MKIKSKTVPQKVPGVAFYGKARIPQRGHRTAVDQGKQLAQKVGGKLTVGLSGAAEPLDIPTKKALAEKLFNHPVHVGTPETRSLHHFLTHMNQHHDDLHLIAGSDRVPEYQEYLKKYNGRPNKKGQIDFNFKSWKVHTAGGNRTESNKDPRDMSEDELTSTVSASKLEKLAKEGNWEHFKAYHAGVPTAHVRKVYSQIRKFHSINEAATIREEITRKELAPMLDSFVSFASKKLGIKSLPSVRHKDENDDYNSFAAYNPSKNELSISTKSRHPMDVFRSIAHELVHHKQNEEGRIGKDIAKEGDTGSDIENEANAEAGKVMRWFAKENPHMFSKDHIIEETISEGINDPGKMKAIFLAGGPGSGKDYVMNSVLQGEGLREVNSDVAFEFLMQKNGLDLEMPENERVEREVIRKKAKKTTRKRETEYLRGRLGVIINGTADDIEKIKLIKQRLEYGGYETMMVFVNTSNDVSRQRNVERGKMGKRKVPDGTDKQGIADNSPDIRTEKWKAAQENIGELQKIFGNQKFAVIDNTVDTRNALPDEKLKVQADFDRVRRMAQQFVRADNKNPRSQKWIEQEAERRGITQYQAPKSFKTLTQIRQDITPMPKHMPDNEVMVQARRLGLSYYGFGRFGRKVNGKNHVLYHSQGNNLVRVMNEDKDPYCIPVNEKFEEFMKEAKGNKPSEREEGTKSLVKVYAQEIPGQEIIAKDGVGPEISTSQIPTRIGSSVTVSESIHSWMNSNATQIKFQTKYGNVWEEKLVEAALRLEKAGCGCDHKDMPKSIKKLMERHMTPEEMKKREEIAKAIHRDNPEMPMSKKMRIATAQAMKEDWKKVNQQDNTDGMSKAAVKAYRRENPGSKLSTAVTEPNPTGKRKNRQHSFCARMGGMPGPMKDKNGEDTPKAASLKRWNCRRKRK
jgi:dephospho-CoA kinase